MVVLAFCQEYGEKFNNLKIEAMKNYIILLLLVTAFITSCDEKEDYEQINSSTMEISGEWWVDYNSDGTDHTGLTKLIISNTAADNGQEIWISDEHNFWAYKVKCPVNMDQLTFSGDNLENIEYEISVKIDGGKMLKDAAKSTSGVVTDSIYFEIEFEDDPGTIYQASGWRKTGFIEDEH